MSIDVSVIWNGARLAYQLPAAAVEGLNAGVEHLLAKSNEKVPVDTGDLRASGSTHPALISDMTAWVVYSAHYAVIVHEGVGMNFSHVKNPNAQAKFLEAAALQYRREIAEIILARIRRELNS